VTPYQHFARRLDDDALAVSIAIAEQRARRYAQAKGVERGMQMFAYDMVRATLRALKDEQKRRKPP